MQVFLIKALQLVLAFSILIIVHEFGHFIFARIFKVRVENFYLFFNPWFSLFKFKPKNSHTEYGVGWLPLGGYVKIAGMIDESMDKEQLAKPPQPWEFRSKKAFPRLLIMGGGVLFNFILAVLIYAGIAYHWGDAILPLRNMTNGMEFSEYGKSVGFQDGDIIYSVDGQEMKELDLQKLGEAGIVTVKRNGNFEDIYIPEDFMNNIIALGNTKFTWVRLPFVVGDVVADSHASQAGMMVNDSVVAINSVPASSYSEVVAKLAENKDSKIDVSLYRNGEMMTIPVVIDEAGKIGVSLKDMSFFYNIEYKKYTFWQSFPVGIHKCYDRLAGYVSSLKYLFTKEGAQSLGGFIAIGNIFPSAWNWYSFWSLTALLSIMLGFMNILPIPALDGGHIFFLLYEIITRRKPSEKFLERAQVAGMLILFALMIFANGNDIIKLLFK